MPNHLNLWCGKGVDSEYNLLGKELDGDFPNLIGKMRAEPEGVQTMWGLVALLNRNVDGVSMMLTGKRLGMVLLLFLQVGSCLSAGSHQWTGATAVDVRAIRFRPDTSLLYLATKQGLFVTADEGRTLTALTNGLPPGEVISVEIDPMHPDTLYAVAGSALYRSDDAGDRWQSLFSWPYTPREHQLVIDPVDGRTLYLVSIDGRITKTTDGGDSWTEAMTYFTEAASCLAVSPSDPEILYAGTQEGNVWRSDDGGTYWYPLYATKPHEKVRYLLVDPRDSETVYLSRYQEGLLKTTDGGLSWKELTVPFNSGEGTAPLISIDPNQPERLFAVSIWGNRAYRSLDGGNSWSYPRRTPGKRLTLVAPAPEMDLLYAAGDGRLYRSTDAGETWSSTLPTVEGMDQDELVIDPNDPKRMYVISSAEASRSSDGGKSWEHLGQSLPDDYFTDLEIDPHDESTLYLGVQGKGIYRSRDRGSSWHSLLPENEADEYENVWQIKVDPVQAGSLYAVTYLPPYTNAMHIERSVDEGQTWVMANKGLPAGTVNGFLLDTRTAGTLYVGTYQGVFKSSDSGDHWYPSSDVEGGGTLGQIEALTLDPRSPKILYCSTYDEKLFKSTNGARTWIRLDGIDSGLPTSERFYRLTVSPHDSAVYAWGTGPTCRSTDGGAHWSLLPDGFLWPIFFQMEPDALLSLSMMKSTNGGAGWYPLRHDLRFASVSGLVSSPSDSRLVFALVNNEGVYKSTDGATTWERSSEGPSLDLDDIKVVGAEPWMLFAIGNDGVYRSSDEGSHWEQVFDSEMGKIAVDPEDQDVIYGVAHGGTLYKTTDAGDTWTECVAGSPLYTLAVSASDPQVLYAGGSEVLIKSLDGGATWSDLNWGDSDRRPIISDLVINAEDPSIVRVGAFYHVPFEPPPDYYKVYDSRDGGLSWAESGYDLDTYPDPLHPEIAYSKSSASFNGGSGWSPVPAPPISRTPSFSVSEPRRAYVGRAGVFALDFPSRRRCTSPNRCRPLRQR